MKKNAGGAGKFHTSEIKKGNGRAGKGGNQRMNSHPHRARIGTRKGREYRKI